MIKQCAVSKIKSRSEINIKDRKGFLPLITAPMYSVVDKHTANNYLSQGVKVCMPRGEYMDETYQNCVDKNYFDSYSLKEFEDLFVKTDHGFLVDIDGNKVNTSVCIDTAVGHLEVLHKAIKKTKELYGDVITIMAGNVGSVEAFIELAKTGVDYIRVGIGGGGGCHTTRNTGVGQFNLETLISSCVWEINRCKTDFQVFSEKSQESRLEYENWRPPNEPTVEEIIEESGKCMNVKIVADGISTYVKQCQENFGFNDNGYAAIIKLLHAGADLVMIGRFFAQCKESAGEKNEEDHWEGHKVLYSGMSTQKEQKGYSTELKPSEGSTTWLPVRWSLREWLYGREDQDSYPFINGFVNSLKSAMSYRGAKTLEEFKQ